MSKFEFPITVGETGTDWEPTVNMKFFAQFANEGAFDFGATPEEAVKNVMALKEQG